MININGESPNSICQWMIREDQTPGRLCHYGSEEKKAPENPGPPKGKLKASKRVNKTNLNDRAEKTDREITYSPLTWLAWFACLPFVAVGRLWMQTCSFIYGIYYISYRIFVCPVLETLYYFVFIMCHSKIEAGSKSVLKGDLGCMGLEDTMYFRLERLDKEVKDC